MPIQSDEIMFEDLPGGFDGAQSRYMQMHRNTSSGVPSAAAANEGGIYYDSDDNRLKVSDGSSWSDITSAANTPLAAGQILVGNASGVAEATSDGAVTISSTDAGAQGPSMSLYHNSASPAAADIVGSLEFYGEDDGDNIHNYSKLDSTIVATTDGSEQGRMRIYVAEPATGNLLQVAQFDHDITSGILSVGDSSTTGVLQSNGSQDLNFRTGSGTGAEITVEDGSNNDIVLTPHGTGSVEIAGGVVHSDITTSSGPGAISTDGRIHEVTSTGSGDAMTLANGQAGQRLTVVYVAEGAGGDTAVITPSTFAGGSTITLNNLGDSCEIVYSSTGGWYVMGLGGAAAVA